MTLNQVHVDDPGTDTAVDSSEEVGGGEGEVTVSEAVTGPHHQGGEGGVGQVILGQTRPRLLEAAVVKETLLVSTLRADHHEQSGPLPLQAGELQAGGRAGQAGPQGGGPALVGD